ncbi:MAG: cysteine--tRNA ligase [Isosphaeraceae bacterium]
MAIRLYNTLTQTKEPLRTVRPGQVGMYVCGPTVYSKSHIGHMVGPVIFDTVKRYLSYNGYEVTWIVNITDVDDKLIVQARNEGTTVADLAARVTDDYLACLKALRVKGIDSMPRATDHIPEIIAMTQGLIDKGLAYPSEGDVYFDVARDADYGKLSHRHLEELLAGARIEPTDKKRHPGDFALWKGSKPGEPSWPSPWGPGRPGWHIECSAMSMKLLGDHFDIHGGGLDLVFPHHENEVAQSESFSGKPFATFWMHNGLLTRDGKKISKSDPGTIVLMADLLEKHEPDTLRALLLSSHYRRPTDYSNARLDEVARGLQTFWNFFDRFERVAGVPFFSLDAPKARAKIDLSSSETLREVADLRNQFLDAMDDDFNTGGALGKLHEMVAALNRSIDRGRLESSDRNSAQVSELEKGARVLRELTQLLGLFDGPRKAAESGDSALTSALIQLLIQLRGTLRGEKNFKLADKIRADLGTLGVTLEDRPGGTDWKIGKPS